MSIPYDGDWTYAAPVNGYASLTQIKLALRVPNTDQVDDDMLALSITTASRTIDEHCNRRFYTNGTETKTYVARDPFALDVDDLVSISSVVTAPNLDGVYDTTWAADDYQAEPLNDVPVTRLRAVGTYAWPVDTTRRRRAGVRVTGVYGYAAEVPTDITQATILLAMRLWKRFDSPTGVAGFGPDLGVVRVSRVDPDVAAILGPYRRDPVGLA